MTLPFSSFFEPSHSRSLSASESKNVDSAWGWRVGGRHLNDERKIIIAGGWLRDASRRLSSKPLYAHVCASILSEMSAVFLFFFFVFLPLGRDSRPHIGSLFVRLMCSVYRRETLFGLGEHANLPDYLHLIFHLFISFVHVIVVCDPLWGKKTRLCPWLLVAARWKTLSPLTGEGDFSILSCFRPYTAVPYLLS